MNLQKLKSMLTVEPEDPIQKEFQDELRDFLNTHLCTPISALCHPYGREIIAYVSGIECEARSAGASEWSDISISSTIGVEWRIKATEPIYEYQWLEKHADGWVLSEFNTIAEAESIGRSPEYRVDATKQVRE